MLQDQIKAGNWLFNLGMRGDLYNGLTIARQAEPRLGVAYNVKPTNTVLRVSYARTLETPFNENLVLSSQGCQNEVLTPLLACSPGSSGALQPGYRNEFHAGLQQAFGKYFVISGDYIWKYTHNAFDFSVLGNTPITFPIDWHNSKIPGFALRADVPNFHNFTAFVVMSSVAARFFPPQSAGAGATVGAERISLPHRSRRELQPDHARPVPSAVQTWPMGRLQLALRQRPDRRLSPLLQRHGRPQQSVAAPSTLPDGTPAIDLSGLTADQQFQAGLACNGVSATPTTGAADALPGIATHLQPGQHPRPEHRE